MERNTEDRQVTDEFAPIELGSVSEETKGLPVQPEETINGVTVSRE